jgi:DNA-binding transcriptional ArsR family regulator
LLAGRGAQAVGVLAAALGLPQPAVSKHLAVLHEVGMVSATRAGRQRIYQLEAGPLRPLYDWVRKFERHRSRQVDRIKERAERTAREKRR